MKAPHKLIVIGGGEHARVVMEAAQSQPNEWFLLGYSNLEPVPETDKRIKIPWLGDDKTVFDKYGQEACFVVGVGSVGVTPRRVTIADKFTSQGTRWGTVVHAKAIVSTSATLHEGVTVMAGAIINSGAVVHRHAIINTAAIIEHDVRIEEFAHVGPGVALGGGCSVGQRSYLGLGSRVRDHVRVGNSVTVGMGSVVIGAVEDGFTVVGVPAKTLRSSRVNA